jgi:hypothetical protein
MRIVDFAIGRYARRQFVDAEPMQKRAVASRPKVNELSESKPSDCL